MKGENTMSEFPSNSYEALAMLYMENQDLSGKTPEELLKLFYETEKKIYDYAYENRNENWMNFR